MSRPKGQPVSGDKAWEHVGLRMTDAEVAEYNRLVQASRERVLTSAEEHRLFVLSQKNRTRTRVF
mgnify:CR=1 FL=1